MSVSPVRARAPHSPAPGLRRAGLTRSRPAPARPGLTLALLLLLLRHGRGAVLSPWRHGPALPSPHSPVSGIAPALPEGRKTRPSPLYGPSRQGWSEPLLPAALQDSIPLKNTALPRNRRDFHVSGLYEVKERFILNAIVPKQLKYSVLVILNKTARFKFSCVF